MRKGLHAGKRKDLKETKKLIPLARFSGVAETVKSGEEPVKKGQSAKSQNLLLDGTELFSKFTADIIKEDVFFTR